MPVRSSIRNHVLFALALALPFALRAQQVAIIEQPLTTPGYPTAVTIGPDRAIWFTGTQGIGRLGPTGAVEYPNGTLVPSPEAITPAPDGALWFPDYFTNSIDSITTSGVMTTYAIGNDLASPEGITLGPDGAPLVHRVLRLHDRSHHHLRHHN